MVLSICLTSLMFVCIPSSGKLMTTSGGVLKTVKMTAKYVARKIKVLDVYDGVIFCEYAQMFAVNPSFRAQNTQTSQSLSSTMT